MKSFTRFVLRGLQVCKVTGQKLNFQIELFKFFSDEKVSLDVGKLIQQMRMEKKLTQKDLATVR